MKAVNDSQNTALSPDVKQQVSRKVYAKPVLTVYGLVREMTLGSASVGFDGTNSFKNPQSDRNVKENIARIGDHPLGIGLYLFDYKPEFRTRFGTGRQFGVMADEVEQVMPQAVSVHADGYKRVDYAMLGILRPLQ